MRRVFVLFAACIAALTFVISCDRSAELPLIELENSGQISFPSEGGEGSMAYTVTNPVEGAVLTVEIPESNTWLRATVADTCINFTVEESLEDSNRNEVFPIRYSYGEKSVETYVSVIQEAAVFDYIIDAEIATCTWYDNVNSVNPDLTNYNILLKTYDGAFAALDLFAPENTEDMLAPVGEYIACEYGEEEGYALSVGEIAYTYVYKITEDMDYEYDLYATLGSEVKISREGDIFTIRAVIVAADTEQKFLIRYTGEMKAVNSFINSSLTGDVDVTYDAAALGLFARGSYYDNSDIGVLSNQWSLYIMNEDYVVGNPVIYIEIFTDPSVDRPALLEGVYTADPNAYDNMTPGTFITGSVGYSGTWYMVVDEITSISAYPGDEAPIMNGTVEFKQNEDGTFDITIDGDDDNYDEPHHVHVVLNNVGFTSRYATAVKAGIISDGKYTIK